MFSVLHVLLNVPKTTLDDIHAVWKNSAPGGQACTGTNSTTSQAGGIGLGRLVCLTVPQLSYCK